MNVNLFLAQAQTTTPATTANVPATAAPAPKASVNAPVQAAPEAKTNVGAPAQSDSKTGSDSAGKETTATVATSSEPPAPAQEPGFFAGLGGFLPIILIIVVMFYLSWRGQKKERKRREDMISSIRKDTKIITVGGIMGTVTEVKESSIVIRVSNSAEIEITKGAVGQVIPEGTTGAEKK